MAQRRNRTRRSDPGHDERRAGGPAQRKVRYAVVGQGYISQAAVLPAFAHASANSELVALVSDDRDKLETLGRRYRVPGLYAYE
jgi:predicted dehydrogenase